MPGEIREEDLTKHRACCSAQQAYFTQGQSLDTGGKSGYDDCNEVNFMKKQEIFSLLQLFLAPALVVFLGLLLLVSPDSASVLISRFLGWVLTGMGVISGIIALFSQRNRVGKLMGAAGLLLCGSILSARPLLLAAFAGRIIGLLLLADGVADLFNAYRRGVRGLMPLIVAVLGGILLLMPMTASRLVFRLCGLVVLIIGCAMVFDRIRHPRLSRGKDDPNIIDAL